MAGSGAAPHPLTAHKGSCSELGPRPWQAAGPPRAGAACAELGLAAVTHGASRGVSSLSAPSLPAPEEFSTPRSPTLRLMTDRACHEGQILLPRSPTACCCSHRELPRGRGPSAPGCCKAGSAPTVPGWHSPDPWPLWASPGSPGQQLPGHGSQHSSPAAWARAFVARETGPVCPWAETGCHRLCTAPGADSLAVRARSYREHKHIQVRGKMPQPALISVLLPRKKDRFCKQDLRGRQGLRWKSQSLFVQSGDENRNESKAGSIAQPSGAVHLR